MALLNSGKINLLKNNTLKSLLFSWPSEVEDMTEGEIDSKLLTNQNYIPIIRRYVDLSYIIRSNTILPIDVKLRKSNIEKDYHGLFNNKEFENLLYHLELYTLDNIQETKSLISIAETIVEIIDKEVENLLQRMRELAVQSANDTNSDQDRSNLQAEMNALITEVDRISSATTWAGAPPMAE